MAAHKDLVMNNRFVVYIGMHRLSFSRISGIEDSITRETYAEGGDNNWPHIMTIPKDQVHTLRLERGLQINSRVSNTIKPGMFIPWVEIIVNDDKGKPLYEYFVLGVYVTKWDIGSLDASTGNVTIEVFEIEHTGIKRSSLR